MSADDKAAAAWDDYVSQQQQEKIEELERQLAAANQRIKRLEDAGDALYENSDPTRWDSMQAANRKLDQQEEWRKAKEAKP